MNAFELCKHSLNINAQGKSRHICAIWLEIDIGLFYSNIKVNLDITK